MKKARHLTNLCIKQKTPKLFFCMCPGGPVVAPLQNLVTQSPMGGSARADANANSGFMVEIFPMILTTLRPSGIKFQENGTWAPLAVRRTCPRAVSEILQNKTHILGRGFSSYRPGVVLTDLGNACQMMS